MEGEALASKKIGKNGKLFCTDETVASKRESDDMSEVWLSQKILFGEDGSEIKMPVNGAAQRFAGVYARCKGMETLAGEMGLMAAFITATLPPQFHSNPGNGNCTYNPELTPNAGHNEMMRRWRALGRDMTRDGQGGIEMFVRCAEPHGDGCEHLHALCYIDPENFNRFRVACISAFGEIGPSLDIRIIEKTDDEKTASPVSYITKYLLKAVNADFTDTDTPVDRARAWRATWGSRGYQIGGKILNGSATAWNECRRLKIDSKRCPALNADAQNIFDLAQGIEVKNNIVARHNFAEFVKATGALKSAGEMFITREKRRSGTTKITGVCIAGQIIDTHPVKFFEEPVPDFSEEKHVPYGSDDQRFFVPNTAYSIERKPAPVLTRAVSDSYPRRAGARASARAYIYQPPPRPWRRGLL